MSPQLDKPGLAHGSNPKGKFDPKFMTALFQTGEKQARSGTAWSKEPPALSLLKPGK